jgi:cytidylate kinase
MKKRHRMNSNVITIDGPVGVGKSTISKILSQKLNYTYLDTGAMYRAFSLKILELGVSIKDKEKIISVIQNTDLNYLDGKVFLDGEDVSNKIRTKEVEAIVSEIAAIPEVRKFMSGIQRRIASKGKVILEGRDCGTVIYPEARYKFYLTASVEERAKRRINDEKYSNKHSSLEEVIESINKRDKIDMTREDSPLKVPDGAMVIDTTNLSIDEVVEIIMSQISSK